MKPRILDLFCGAGGAGDGYARAGFDVVGVDVNPQPDYPFEFHCADAIEVLTTWDLRRYDAIHASPPCHDHSTLSAERDGTGWLLEETVAHLVAKGKPWVCENVVGPDVRMDGWWFVLCGSSFGMKVRRHRRFGSSLLMLPPPCRHQEQGRPYTITGNGDKGDPARRHSLKPPSSEFWRYLDMPWMEGRPHHGVAQAIPPAYTEWIGGHLLAHLSERAA